jgi:alcohol dehydrogenase
MKKLQNLGRIGRMFSAGETLIGVNALAGLARLGVARATVVVSPSVWACHTAYIKKCLSRCAINVIIAPSGEPCMEAGLNLSRQLQQFSPDVVIAIGGGSVMDLAKLAWILYEKPELDLQSDRVVLPVSSLRSRTTGFIAVPTTYGSGSENSSAAVFQSEKLGKKRFLVGPELAPDIAVLDPALAMALPIGVAASGVMDTLAHAIEGYVSKGANAATKHLSLSSIIPLKSALSGTRLDALVSDEKAVESFMVSAAFAGVVQNIANPGLAHSLSHYCSRYGVGHGQGCGYYLPLSLRYNAQDDAVAADYDALATGIGFSGRDALIDWLQGLSDQFELNHGVPTAAEIYNSLEPEAFFADPTTTSNPITIDLDRVFQLMDIHHAT